MASKHSFHLLSSRSIFSQAPAPVRHFSSLPFAAPSKLVTNTQPHLDRYSTTPCRSKARCYYLPVPTSKRYLSTTSLQQKEQSSSNPDQGGASPITSTSNPNEMSSGIEGGGSAIRPPSERSKPSITSYAFEDIREFVENPAEDRILIGKR